MLALISKEDEVSSRGTFGFEFGFSVEVFGYVFDFAFDLFDWQLKTWDERPIGMSVWLGPFYLGVVDHTIRHLEQPDDELLALQETEKQVQIKYRQALETIEELRLKLRRSHKKKEPSPFKFQEVKPLPKKSKPKKKR